MIRNFINIIGITPEDELPYKNNGQFIHFSETETIFIPIESPKIKNIYEVTIDVEVKSNRIIKYSLGRICVIDGIKKFKIIYTDINNTEKAHIFELNVPFNTFIELTNNSNNIVHDIKIHIVDAYFDLLANDKIYSHILYFIDVQYNLEKIKVEENIINNDISFDEISINDNTTNNKSIDNLLLELDSKYMNNMQICINGFDDKN